jgi:hypothetical protein
LTVRLLGRLFAIDSLRGSRIRIHSGTNSEPGEYSRHQEIPGHRNKTDEKEIQPVHDTAATKQ